MKYIQDVNKLKRQAFRFFFAGVINTGATIILYQLLLFLLSPAFSYCITWFFGVVFVSIIYPFFIFDKKGKKYTKINLQFALIYITCFLIGLALNQSLIIMFDIPRLAIFFTLCFTSLVSFLMMRLAAEHS
ncbi:GtrA family protein [Bartonella apis]|uniref:GtrA family protein n=1 Tax=Bartonella apis TaxID=1686310 RepID=UPI00242B19B8|nr:GtrA family protein [Bartonella apis]